VSRVSLILITYQQEAFVQEALRSVLAQDCAPAEVLIADDASTDGTYDIIEEECRQYDGPHKVQHWRNKSNLVSENVLQCAARATGDYLVMFHGDDISYPGRTTRLLELFEQTGASLIGSNARIIDENGTPGGTITAPDRTGPVTALETATSWDRRMLGATQAMRRDVFERFQPWTKTTVWGGWDHVLPFRGALLGGMHYTGEVLMDWRQHVNNMGKAVSDWTVGGDVSTETSLASYLTTRIYMRDDLARFMAAEGATPERQQLLDTMDEDLRSRLRDWSVVRNGLLGKGYRATWADRVAMEEKYRMAGQRVGAYGMPIAKRVRFKIAKELRRAANAIS
jgi:glycosyltransferase involved in cell wall biosynthesis